MKNFGWYRRCFGTLRGKVLLDCFTGFSAAPLPQEELPPRRLNDVPQRIHAIRPDAHFIYVFSDPAEGFIYHEKLCTKCAWTLLDLE